MIRRITRAVWDVVTAPEARRAELTLARIILAGLAAKLGFDFAAFLG